MAYRSLGPFDVEAKDGLWVSLRDVVPDDGDLIELGFDRLSKRLRFFRFMASKSRLTDAEIDLFSALNTVDHAAVGALSMPDDKPQPVGIARYVRTSAESHSAEIAVTVVDAFHNRGIGTLLLGILAKMACANGISEFLALVDSENAAMRHLLLELGGTEEAPNEPEISIRVPIYQDPTNYPDNEVGAYVRRAYSYAQLSDG